ncbi:MAG: hypothetical protein V7603_1459 [Micromonosporaceae bacterium]
MRVLLTAVSGQSHLHTMVPFAAALRSLGHEVAFSTAPEMGGVCEALGFPLLPSGPGRLRLRTEMIRSHPDEVSADIRDWRNGARIFGDIAPRLRVEQLAAVVASFRPDLLVHEALEFAGPLVAAEYGIPHLYHAIGPFHPDSLGAVWERAEPLYRRRLGSSFGLGDVLQPYLDPCPPLVQTEAGRALAPVIPMRLHAYHGAGRPDPAAVPVADRAGESPPRVLFTFGTVSNAAIDGFVDCAAALGERGWRAVVTVGPRGWFDWLRAGPATERPEVSVTENVRVVDYVPLDAELAHTAVLVHHGGANTTRAAIEWGVPSLVIPQAAEQYRNARWIEAVGLGTVLLPDEVSPARVADTVAALLADRDVGQATAAVRSAWRAMPPPEDAMGAVAALVSAGATAVTQ